MSIPTPQSPAPELDVPLVGGGRWRLADQSPDTFSLVVFYRGLHCPVCKGYLATLDGLVDDFAGQGVTSVVAVSTDTEDRAATSVEDWGLENLSVGHSLSIDDARKWGLFISKGISEDEPDQFSEPGLFLIRPDASVYYAAVNSMPFGRPDLNELVGAVGFVTKQDYPARGES